MCVWTGGSGCSSTYVHMGACGQLSIRGFLQLSNHMYVCMYIRMYIPTYVYVLVGPQWTLSSPFFLPSFLRPSLGGRGVSSFFFFFLFADRTAGWPSWMEVGRGGGRDAIGGSMPQPITSLPWPLAFSYFRSAIKICDCQTGFILRHPLASNARTDPRDSPHTEYPYIHT